MTGIKDALAEINNLKPGDKLVYQQIADKHGVDRSTLSRRHKQIQADQETKSVNQQKLTARHIPPTTEMIQNFASSVAQEPVSESWVTRFINKYSIHLISQYSTGMDANRHNVNSYTKCKLYFDLLQAKIAQYNVDAEHTYNMDKKGFIIGVTTRTKHVFSRRMWEKKEVKASLQDGNRAWVTLIACVCGDGSALPPGLLYESANSTIKSSWVEDIKPGITLYLFPRRLQAGPKTR
jgi:hypothetical protein